MATEAQIRANRRNAQKSTGPRTRQGKAALSQNAVKHGLSARQAIISAETQADFELYRSCFVNARSWNFLKKVEKVNFLVDNTYSVRYTS